MGLLSYSYRRQVLDIDLARTVPLMQGVVLDVGGRRAAWRGRFRPPERVEISAWWVVNIAHDALPHVSGSAERLPVQDSCADTVMCTEVLEHIFDPEAALVEIARVLKSGGWLILSMPFLCPVHGDPCDYQRFTEQKLQRLLVLSGFEQVNIRKQGLYFTVVCDYLRFPLSKLRPALLRWTLGGLFLPIAAVLRWLECSAGIQRSEMFAAHTTGYFLTARRTILPVASAEAR